MTYWSEKYKDVVAIAVESGELGTAARLKRRSTAARVTLLRADITRALKLFSVGEKDSNVHDWKKIDTVVARHTQLLCAAIADVHLLHFQGYETKKWEQERQTKNHIVPEEQGKEMLRVLMALPRSGNRVINEEDFLRDVGQRVYTETRAYIYARLAEAWAKTRHNELAHTFFRQLFVSGAYNDFALQAVTQWREQAGIDRVQYSLQQLHGDKFFTRHVPGGTELFTLLKVRWVRLLDTANVLRHTRLNEVLGSDLSPVGLTHLIAHASKLRKLEDTARSFFGPHSYTRWDITELDFNRNQVIVVHDVPRSWRPEYVESAKRDLKQRLATWENPHPDVQIVAILRGTGADDKGQQLDVQMSRFATAI